EHHLRQVLVEQELRDLLRVRGHGDPGPDQMMALGAAVERRRVYPMPGGPQAFEHRLPDPASLIRAVNQNIGGHRGSFGTLAMMGPETPPLGERSVHEAPLEILRPGAAAPAVAGQAPVDAGVPSTTTVRLVFTGSGG